MRKKTCTKISVAQLFVVANPHHPPKWENEGIPFYWAMAEPVVVSVSNEHYCAERNNELEEFHSNWKVPQGIDAE